MLVSPLTKRTRSTGQAPQRPRTDLRRGFGWTLGALAAIATGFALYGLRGIVVSIFIAAFITVGLDPLIRFLQRHHFTRGVALLTVILLVVALVVAIIWVVLPLVIDQIELLATSIPKEIDELKQAGWFDPANAASNGVIGNFLTWLGQFLTNPQVWANVLNGIVDFGLGLVSGISAGFFVFILVIYFLATYDVTKQAAYKLVSASHRDTFVGFAERILQNIGKYLSGMVTVAFINAVWSFLLLVVTGVPGAFLIALIAFFVTLIPLVGTVLTTIGMTIIAFIHSPVSALVVLLAMLVYMQVESYVIDPKIMGKAVQVPGSVVLISAMAGGALFGLAGALVAIPVSASIILIIREVVWPAKERS
jgi:predicted PurR-regulated permease PerM